ncbi:lymphocyte antigen-6, epidermis [Sardina pilchardus]|uniref:lymphocyte antigen-6, epidermis n=1 Tax=Sardina pilchardus TaxID=27697 RepID=UPI002E0EA41A
MAKVLWAIVAVATCFVMAESLRCNSCAVGLLGKCLLSSEKTCSGSEDRCYTGKAEFNITGAVTFETSGCLVNTSCVKSTGSVLGVGYTVTRTCCSTDLCNAATSGHLPVTTAIGAALMVSVWASGMF